MEPHAFLNPGGQEKAPDSRDIKLGVAAMPKYTFPPILTNNDAWKMPIEYQGQQPACGAHSGAEVKDLALGTRFSPRFTWGDLKSFDGFPIDSGTDMRSIFKSITKTGVLAYSEYGNDVSLSEALYATPPTQLMRLHAGKSSGMGYGFTNNLSFDGLKQFLSDHGPTIILLRVGAEWWTAKNGASSWQEKDILPLRIPKAIVSGHFVVAHSYDEKYIYFLNHWSADWGRKGHGYFGPEYMVYVNDAGALFSLKFQKDLSLGMTDPDVLLLQKYLNSHGYTVASSGPGSPGNETNYFGALTKTAVEKLQLANGISPVLGYCGPLTRAFIQTHQ